jgi:glycerol-3-phosphate dehydrogenase (NAD(P)+)
VGDLPELGEVMFEKVTVVGAGSWGTVIAAMTGRRVPTTLWARRPDLADGIQSRRVNPAYFPDYRLPDGVRATSSLADATDDSSIVIMAVPSHGFRDVLTEVNAHLAPTTPILSVTKGLEEHTLLRMTEIVAELRPTCVTGVLTGPNLAEEVVAGFPAASVVAMTEAATAAALQALLSTEAFRVYTNPDVVGCEVAGALKNVVAIAAGMADGMGFGDNARAALITRGLAELTRLGVSLGGQLLTFSGLAGMGDLVATCISRRSRNRHVGEQLALGRRLEEIEAETQMVAEGVKTSRVVVELAGRVGIEVPIAEQVVEALYRGKSAADVMAALMQRASKSELHGLAT